MCLTTKSLAPVYTLAQLADIATEQAPYDMVCYKRFIKIDDSLQTPHRNTVWPATGELTVTGFGTRIANSAQRTIEVHQGIHAYITEHAARVIKAPGEVIRKMIIPANTPYI